ncbi:MAG: Fe-S cluster assembly sulfur transfer protein SufU [Planctomycetota bacterium]
MDLRELYQETILDHNKAPRNYGEIPGASHTAHGHNPLCGDRVTVQACVDDQGRITEVRFQGNGCAISTASASMLTEALQGKTVAEANTLVDRFQELIRLGADGSDEELQASLGKLAVFAGVCDYPSRVTCATLAWHTLRSALETTGADASTGPVTTE